MEKTFDHPGSSKVPPAEGFREAFILHLADNSLILGHRNSEWCGHGPVLEQDIALTNISLDLIGQARNFYQYAARLINKFQKTEGSRIPPSGGGGAAGFGEATEDSLAYLRDVRDFKNCLLVEQPNGDWAQTILRQFLCSNYQYLLYQQLQSGNDEQIAAIAVKSLKEVTYHLRWSSEWVIRLGDGTDESHQRMMAAIDTLWPFTQEFFLATDYEREAAANGMGNDMAAIKPKWENRVKEVFAEGMLAIPEKTNQQSGGKAGKHSGHLDKILADLQYLQRTYPGAEW